MFAAWKKKSMLKTLKIVVSMYSLNISDEANWMAFCHGFTNFCQAASEAVVLSFVAAAFFLCLVPVSALALKRDWLGVSLLNHDGVYLGISMLLLVCQLPRN